MFLLLATSARGDDLFSFLISVDGSPAHKRGINDIRRFLELFDNGSLRQMFPSYTPQSSMQAIVNARGLRAILSYQANSSELRLAIPELGLDVRFPGRDRDESQEWLEEWIKGLKQIKSFASRADLTLLLQGAVQYSPVDPVAGNPNSLQSRMFLADFQRAIYSPHVSLAGDAADEGKPPGSFNVEVNYGAYNAASDFGVQSLGMSLGGLINFGNRHWAMLIDWPVLATWTESAESVMTYPGVGVQYRVNDHWQLTAFGRAGIVGSIKVGALSGIYSGTLTSYMWEDFGKLTVGWGLMGGFGHTIDGVEWGGTEVTYDLLNYPLSTGLDVGGPLNLWSGRRQPAWSVYANYTHLFGSELFLEDFMETGIGFNLRTEQRGSRGDWMRFQVGYLFGIGNDYDGISTRLSFAF